MCLAIQAGASSSSPHWNCEVSAFSTPLLSSPLLFSPLLLSSTVGVGGQILSLKDHHTFAALSGKTKGPKWVMQPQENNNNPQVHLKSLKIQRYQGFIGILASRLHSGITKIYFATSPRSWLESHEGSEHLRRQIAEPGG